MKKLLIALSMAALFSGSALADEEIVADLDTVLEVAPVTQGTLNFNGEVLPETCTILEADKTVKLPSLLLSELNSGKSSKTNFNITLGSCLSNGKNVSVKFTPVKDSLDGDLLKNTADDSYKAQNVLLHLTDADTGNTIKLSNQEQEVKNVLLDKIGAETTYSFDIEYKVKSGKEATPGNVQATLPFEIVYK